MSMIPTSTRRRSLHFSVDGVAIYEPDAEVKITHESLVDSDSGRTRDGIMHINWIRTDLLKFELSYAALTSDEYQFTVDLVQGKTFTWGYYSEGQYRTIQAYCSNHSYTTFITDDVTRKGLYKSLTFSIIER